ncbi:hypothetical protein D3C85_1519850 [compost metagenome]
MVTVPLAFRLSPEGTLTAVRVTVDGLRMTPFSRSLSSTEAVTPPLAPLTGVAV